MRKYVIDASTCLKWVFVEQDSEIALRLLSDLEQNKVLLVIPSIWHYEIINALSSAVKRKKITHAKSKVLLKSPNKILLIF